MSSCNTTFAWGSDARGKAHVHVVILGLDQRAGTGADADKRLFTYPDINGEPEESRHRALSPYLFDPGGLADPHGSMGTRVDMHKGQALRCSECRN